MHAGDGDEQVNTVAAAARTWLCASCQSDPPALSLASPFPWATLGQQANETEKPELVQVGLTSSCSTYFVAVFESVCATHLAGC